MSQYCGKGSTLDNRDHYLKNKIINVLFIFFLIFPYVYKTIMNTSFGEVRIRYLWICIATISRFLPSELLSESLDYFFVKNHKNNRIFPCITHDPAGILSFQTVVTSYWNTHFGVSYLQLKCWKNHKSPFSYSSILYSFRPCSHNPSTFPKKLRLANHSETATY